MPGSLPTAASGELQHFYPVGEHGNPLVMMERDVFTYEEDAVAEVRRLRYAKIKELEAQVRKLESLVL